MPWNEAPWEGSPVAGRRAGRKWEWEERCRFASRSARFIVPGLRSYRKEGRLGGKEPTLSLDSLAYRIAPRNGACLHECFDRAPCDCLTKAGHHPFLRDVNRLRWRVFAGSTNCSAHREYILSIRPLILNICADSRVRPNAVRRLSTKSIKLTSETFGTSAPAALYCDCDFASRRSGKAYTRWVQWA